MARTAVDEGRELLARRAELVAVQAATAEAVAAAEHAKQHADLVSLLGPQLVTLMGTILDRLAGVEAQLAAQGVRLEARMDATRVRRPVRDDRGQILYVIDELDPPTYALPVSGGVQPFGG